MSKKTNGLPKLKAKKVAFKAKRALRNKNPKNVVPVVGYAGAWSLKQAAKIKAYADKLLAWHAPDKLKEAA